ncbi:MAG: hypothetical protein M1812_002447 [Candelaria pacifica]|nr:MAG: hypothetical protein M1812_002447 [Candelaria pacifica]
MAPLIVGHSTKLAQTGNRDGMKPRDSALLHRVIYQTPPNVVDASGNYLLLDTGQRILDAAGGAAVVSIGHGNRHVKEAIIAQLNQVAFCYGFGSSGSERLARLLIETTKGRMSKAFIVSSGVSNESGYSWCLNEAHSRRFPMTKGSEAMESAMKMARQYFLEISPPQQSRTRFIARKESYHGNTLGALAMSGHVVRRQLYEPMLTDNISHVSACNAYRGMLPGETVSTYVDRLAQELENEFQRVGPEIVCAFVAEPVVGAALGCVPSVKGYFRAMKAVCDRHGALLIFDEVMCGIGRTGTLHAWEQEGVVPDIQTIGKGLGGGYVPVAGILINRRVVDALTAGTGSFVHGQTYQGHPVACAAAAAVLSIITETSMMANVNGMSRLLFSLLNQRLGKHPNVGDIRGRGLFVGIEFVQDKATKKPFDPKAKVAAAIQSKGHEPGYEISLYPGNGTVDGRAGDHILLAPPYNITREDVEEMVERTARVIFAVLKT